MAYISNHTGQTIDSAVNTVNNFDVSQLRDFFYPIGSIYTSTKSTSPATLFGGTWVQIKDTFLLTAGDTYNAGSTGGSANHTHTSAAHTHTTAGHALTVNEIPGHNHSHPNNGHTFSWGDRNSTLWLNSGQMVAQGATNNGLSSYQGPNNYTNYTGGNASHSHGNTGSTTPGATGSSSSLPPYRVVYAWKRTT